MNGLRRGVLRVNRYGSIPIRLFSEVTNDNKSDSNGGEEKKKKRAKVVL